MAKLDEMSHGSVDARGIVQQDGADLGIFQVKLCEYDGHVVDRELIEHRLFTAEGEHGDALHFALQHASYAVGQLVGFAVGGADQDLVAASDGDFFEAGNELREEGIGNVFNNDPKNTAPPRYQAPRMGVGEVIELFDGLPDALRQFLADRGRLVDGA